MKPITLTQIRQKLLPLVLAAQAFVPVLAADTINLYTTREPALIKPILDRFTAKTGIAVQPLFLKDGVTERLVAEGPKSPADVIMLVDIGQLQQLVDAGVTQAIDDPKILAVVPEHLRDANQQWVSLSLRARVAYVAKDLPMQSLNYLDLAKPEWKGRVCLRSGQHPYNIGLFAAMVAHFGVEKTELWLRGLKANLARKPTGGDRDVARDILGGICDIGFANSYYVGIMRSDAKNSENYAWGHAINVLLPTFGTGMGTHVNVSGVAIARHTSQKPAALTLINFLLSPDVQKMYAEGNFELPVRQGVQVNPLVANFGAFQADRLPLSEIVKFRQVASELVDKVGFNQ